MVKVSIRGWGIPDVLKGSVCVRLHLSGLISEAHSEPLFGSM